MFSLDRFHKGLYGLSDIARLLGISRQALYSRIKHGGKYTFDIPDPAYETSLGSLWTYEQLDQLIMKSSPYSEWGQAKDAWKDLHRKQRQASGT